MSVTYTKKMRDQIKLEPHRRLVTVDALGVCFQGSVPAAVARDLCKWMSAYILTKEQLCPPKNESNTKNSNES